MPRKKGTQKTGGRQKGTPNKATSTTRKWLKTFLDNNQGQIEKDFKALEPKERIQAFERLLQYTLPKMQSSDINLEFEKLSDENLDLIINSLSKNILENGNE
jgi:hypothetical protein